MTQLGGGWTSNCLALRNIGNDIGDISAPIFGNDFRHRYSATIYGNDICDNGNDLAYRCRTSVSTTHISVHTSVRDDRYIGSDKDKYQLRQDLDIGSNDIGSDKTDAHKRKCAYLLFYNVRACSLYTAPRS